MVLTDKAKNNELIAIEKFAVAEPKTKAVSNIVKSLLLKVVGKKSGSSLIVADADKNLKLACRNLKDADFTAAKDLNILEVLTKEYLIIDKDALRGLEKRLAGQH